MEASSLIRPLIIRETIILIVIYVLRMDDTDFPAVFVLTNQLRHSLYSVLGCKTYCILHEIGSNREHPMLCRHIVGLLLLVLPHHFRSSAYAFSVSYFWLRALPRRRLMSSPLLVAPPGVPREGKATNLVVVYPVPQLKDRNNSYLVELWW
ncbi:hypothetical protein BDV40DRAFT_277290 [Aspergillus tamarii]|uniref:Uncharacterized protein n=1 Tax=Aspergillus tamarii TaxID=41984 RepID=A0A5N6UGR3_ASPTM|nr:hypothetical protein BDV40DRAFT_277290 [Aspergillus tamarii]